ncbi:hypothetical protein SAMN04487911_12310 [Arenibacter nanhaiticus]|uniref:DUF192 domain-containing protein n=1 Tax=Arenibacter nanhaiticus TaxID=558155 RepID=A0A1M6JTC7_9FLAO|nr:DUF192 domain-containing protein [Arenibacter nanhaiticus]SHJ49974.1 hypothetical protein SAMN04487911_12310 [Arenibacter nanhaiticus]
MTTFKLKAGFFTAIFCIFFSLHSCKEQPKNIVERAPITFTKDGELSILKKGTETAYIKFDIEISESEYETQTGLMYRSSMEDTQGMLFIFEDVAMRSFYMKNTEIPLDIIFIDENMHIVSFQKNANPFDEAGLTSTVPAKYVFEINAGIADSLNLEVGDLVQFQRN